MGTVLILDDNHDLATLLAGAVTDRGHQPVVMTTGRDALAALGKQSFDAALVDLLLPDLRGQEVLRALAERGVPALAMSGVFRGPHFEKEVTGPYGASAFFEKPFDLEALLTRLAELVGHTESPTPPAVEASLPLAEAVDVDPTSATTPEAQRQALHTLEVERALLEKQHQQQSAGDPRQSASATSTSASASASASASSTSSTTAAPSLSLSDLPFSGRRVWSGDVNSPQVTAGNVSREVVLGPGPGSGPLSGTSVVRLLAAAHQGLATGELRLKRNLILKVIWLKEGRPIYAASNVASERFGRHAVARGAVRAEELVAVQELATKEKVRTGEAMVRMGLIDEARRLELLHDQAQQILWSTFDWVEGEYQYYVPHVARPEVVPLTLPLPPLVLRGLAQLPLVRLRARLANAAVPIPAADPAFELHELELDDDQARLVAAADGTKNVEDLLALSDLEERDALALLLGLLELRILEPRVASSPRRIVLV